MDGTEVYLEKGVVVKEDRRGEDWYDRVGRCKRVRRPSGGVTGEVVSPR